MFGQTPEDQPGYPGVSATVAAVLCVVTLGAVIGMAAFVTWPRPHPVREQTREPYKKAA